MMLVGAGLRLHNKMRNTPIHLEKPTKQMYYKKMAQFL